jgi:secreted Zn-dependent insulinase-like peptidase
MFAHLISPLYPRLMEREMQAVHSENEKNLNHDTWFPSIEKAFELNRRVSSPERQLRDIE